MTIREKISTLLKIIKEHGQFAESIVLLLMLICLITAFMLSVLKVGFELISILLFVTIMSYIYLHVKME